MLANPYTLPPLILPLPKVQDINVTSLHKKPIVREDYKIGSSLKALLEYKPTDIGYIDNNEKIKVVITVAGLNADEKQNRSRESIRMNYSVQLDEFKESVYTLDNKTVALEDITKLKAKSKAHINKWLKLVKLKYKVHIYKILRKTKWLNNKSIKQALKNADSSFSVSLTKLEIQKFYKNFKGIVLGIDLPMHIQNSEAKTDNLASAMQATNINPDALRYSNSKGSGINIYINEIHNCPSPNIILFQNKNNYTKEKDVFGAYVATKYISNHSILVGGIIRKVSPQAHLYCNSMNQNINESNYSNPFPKDNLNIDIESYSFNAYDNEENPNDPSIKDNVFEYNREYQTIDEKFDNHVIQTGNVVFVSAGNKNSKDKNPNNYVLSPAKALNVITVGNYDPSTYNINQNGNATSSYQDPSTKNQKPEISAPGTNMGIDYVYKEVPNQPIGIKYIEYNITDSGTSFSTPFAAAFAANAMSSNISELKNAISPAAIMKAFMIANATKNIGGGHDRVGEGGIDFHTVRFNTKLIAEIDSTNVNQDFPLIGSNSSGSWYCNTEHNISISSSKSEARFVISWLNDGTYIKSHNKTQMDFDLHIYGPGKFDYSPDKFYYGLHNVDKDSYAMVKFNPTVSGLYTAFICMKKYPSTSPQVKLGYVVTTKD